MSMFEFLDVRELSNFDTRFSETWKHTGLDYIL